MRKWFLRSRPGDWGLYIILDQTEERGFGLLGGRGQSWKGTGGEGRCGKEGTSCYADKSPSDDCCLPEWLSSWFGGICTNIYFLYKRRNIHFILRQLGESSKGLFLLVLSCLQLQVIFMPVGVIIRWLILLLIPWPLSALLFCTEGYCLQEAVDMSKAKNWDNKETTKSENKKLDTGTVLDVFAWAYMLYQDGKL